MRGSVLANEDREVLFLIDLRLKLDEIKDESIIENKGAILSFKIQYKNLIGNQYEQDLNII